MSRVLAKRELVCHPETAVAPVFGCSATMLVDDHGFVTIEYNVAADLGAVRVPVHLAPERADNLWTTTCFEAFAMAHDGQYLEFNFSPSTCWAAYDFSSYRRNMAPATGAIPSISVENTGTRLVVTASVDLMSYMQDWPERIGLSAVIETGDGTKSYWALAHPSGRPDFHHKDCFALALPAPETR